MTAAATLARWGLGLTFDDVPDRARRAVSRHLLDAVGTAVAGRRHGGAGPAWTVAHAIGGPQEARALTGQVRLSAPAAALASGALIHSLDFDDTHPKALVHVSAVNVPAAFAVGQEVGASGRQVMESLVVGYEAVCRIGAATQHGFHTRGLHATSVCGTLSSALVAARLLRLPTPRAVDALGVAGSASGGLLEFLDAGSDTKVLHPGMASFNGIVAARLAEAGGAGPASVLEGRRGLYAALSTGEADIASITDGLGVRWECEQIALKPYPNCQLMHVALDSLGAAVGSQPPPAEEIRSVVLDVHPDSLSIVWGPNAGRGAPRSPYDAKFDMPWSAAALLVDGAITLDTYTTASIARSDVLAIARRVGHVVQASEGPAANAPGRAVVELADGSQMVGAVTGSSGGPLFPLSDEALAAKFAANCGGHPQAGELAERLLALAGEASLDGILDLCAGVSSNDRPIPRSA